MTTARSLNIAGRTLDDLIAREWIYTNRLGGYASSTVAGMNTRKYHGLLVAAMTPPVRRMVILSRVDEIVTQSGKTWELGASEYPDTVHPQGFNLLRGFTCDPSPRWAYQADGWTIQKELRLIPGRNAVVISYTLIGRCEPIELELRPLLALRGIHDLMFQWNGALDAETKSAGAASLHRIPATSRTPEVFFAHDGKFSDDSHWYLNAIYRRERERGYAGLEDLWNPGVVRFALRAGQSVHLACSTEPIDLPRMIERPPARVEVVTDPILATLTSAAKQFELDARAAGVLTALPWSPPSVRDALIALSGLFLITERHDEARQFLESLASQCVDGMIPTALAEDGGPPIYDGADTSLWFVHAVGEYLRYTNDPSATGAGVLFDACAKIIERYRTGTAGLGITCDANGLLASRMPGVGTTWMNAKVGDWVITPRAGCTVELNALWYNALRLVAPWCATHGQPTRSMELIALADRLKVSFNEAFWNDRTGCCFDVINEQVADASIRPNQLLAISLPHAVLSSDRHAAVMSVIQEQLLTPFGLRTLSPRDPSYQDRYAGDVVSRDRAYHQGTVFPWLLGPYITAMMRLQGRSTQRTTAARALLAACIAHMNDVGNGQLCELFDGDPPHAPGGAIASARSAGELLRAYVEEILEPTHKVSPPRMTHTFAG